MNLNTIRCKNLSYAIVDDFYEDEELKEILTEIKDLKRLAAGPEHTFAATTEDGKNYKKTGEGFFLDDIYKDRCNSSVLNYSRKMFDHTFCQRLIDFDATFNAISNSNQDTILVNYYSPGEEYAAHRDTTHITAVTLFGFGPFTGGGFCFPEQNEVVPFKQNRLIVFPSCVSHASEPFVGPRQSYRVSLAHFITNVAP